MPIGPNEAWAEIVEGHTPTVEERLESLEKRMEKIEREKEERPHVPPKG